MRLYGISGLGADKRVFSKLKLDCELIPLEWITPKKKEPIENYAMRLAEIMKTDKPYGLLGVSFGGLITMEISKRLNPAWTILISSAETKGELRSIYRVVGKSGLLNLLPKELFTPPGFLANWLFGAQNKKLLSEILSDTDLDFAKWAIQELTNWKNTERIKNKLLKIHGTNDKLIPLSLSEKTILVRQGTHFMIVDRADEISEIINRELKK